MTSEQVATVRAAKLLAVSRQHVLRLIKTGELDAEEFQVGDRTFHSIPLDALREYQRKREQKVRSAPINDLPLAGTVSTSPADGAGQALADTTSGGQ